MTQPVYVFRRMEKKYLLSAEQCARFLEACSPHIQPNAYGRYTVLNCYCDTPDDLLVRRSMERPVFKEKLRLRSYGAPDESDRVFLEMKRKISGVVYKRRTELELGRAREILAGRQDIADGQIEREIGYFLSLYHPVAKCILSYERSAFDGTDQPGLRLTVDQGLRARWERLDLALGSEGEPLFGPHWRLLEIKTPDALPLWLTRLLCEMQVRPVSFSKYGNAFAARETMKRGKQTCLQVS
ncbi:polyphosphate polymerase domain-containing protein [Feifania hominis]|uniref:Polyphosphate polymerase domain-containing protein n=1 Tax=Feifania hominis TaxID=2763660 RepID=A0A926HQ68_9FIRM|nr:polyphosphate polymerase domain-containing protein [Feifania hominis]MBC8536027.1 polyphosphate polymerase domain-containing protein [Feifania hominis]